MLAPRPLTIRGIDRKALEKTAAAYNAAGEPGKLVFSPE
jgi:hypothetical protein